MKTLLSIIILVSGCAATEPTNIYFTEQCTGEQLHGQILLGATFKSGETTYPLVVAVDKLYMLPAHGNAVLLGASPASCTCQLSAPGYIKCRSTKDSIVGQDGKDLCKELCKE